MTIIEDAIVSLAKGESLEEDQAKQLFDALLLGEASEAQWAALLMGFQVRGPQVAELVGGARALREAMVSVQAPEGAIDNCGTGGSIHKTANVSTLAALALASDGVVVAKHGNRSVTRPSGSADMLESSGYPLDLDASALEELLNDQGIAFLFAPQHHPALAHAAPVRRTLGIPTIFNLLGPLCNPTGVEHQVLGVGRKELLPLLAGALAKLGVRSALVVHGDPGFDEATPAGPLHLIPVVDGRIGSEEIWNPQDLGIEPCRVGDLLPLGDGQAVAEGRDLLQGRGRQGVRDTIALNMSLAYRALGIEPDLAHGVQRARQVLLSGSGVVKWDAMVQAAKEMQHGG